MSTFNATVRDIVWETRDTVTLVLDADVPRDYLAGQFLNVDPHGIPATSQLAKELEARKGKKERPRSYSLASAPHESGFAITIKEEPAGEFPALLTPHLVRGVRVGDTLPCAGFAGLYTLPDDLPAGAHVVHVCAGSGVVPNYGMIKDALHRKLPIRQTVLDSNKSWEDVIYREHLTRLAVAHADSLQIIHFLTRSREGAPGKVYETRITPEQVREHVPDLADAHFFVCGPSIPAHERLAARRGGPTPVPRFLESMKALLLDLGVPKQHINAEGW